MGISLGELAWSAVVVGVAVHDLGTVGAEAVVVEVGCYAH